MDAAIGLHLHQYSGSGSDKGGAPERLAANGRGPRRGRILIMDDEPAVCATMARQLAIFGFEAEARSDGEAAVDAFRLAREGGCPFDAVILDLVVDNGWGGERTLGELRRLDPDVKALLCSGSLSGRTAEYLALGFRAVLAKPYSLSALRSVVEGVVPQPQPDR